MKKIGILFVLLLASSGAHGIQKKSEPLYYFGIDAQWREVDFSKEVSKPEAQSFSHKSPQGHLCAGFRLNENLWLEGSLHHSQRRKQSGNVDSAPLKIRTHGQKLTLLSHFKVSDKLPLTLVLGGGVTNLKALFTSSGINAKNLDIDKRLFHFKGGFQSMLNENMAVRLLTVWENTSKLKNKQHGIKGRDSFVYSIGTAWYF